MLSQDFSFCLLSSHHFIFNAKTFFSLHASTTAISISLAFFKFLSKNSSTQIRHEAKIIKSFDILKMTEGIRKYIFRQRVIYVG